LADPSRVLALLLLLLLGLGLLGPALLLLLVGWGSHLHRQPVVGGP
jgi:hypothetical protein